jgi:hypothetical protein
MAFDEHKDQAKRGQGDGNVERPRGNHADAGEMEDGAEQKRPHRQRNRGIVVAGDIPVSGESVRDGGAGPPAFVSELGLIDRPD